MEYRIDHIDFDGAYSREEVQNLINERRINLNTKIWKAGWGDWQKLRDTDFDLSKANKGLQPGLPDGLFLGINSYLNYIDEGHIFRKPFSWLYAFFAIINILLPLYFLFLAFDKGIFDAESRYIVAFILIWLVMAYAGWVSFQLWWDRKTKVLNTSTENDEFVATPVFSHFMQTFGEWMGTWIGIVGFSSGFFMLTFLGNDRYLLSNAMGLDMFNVGIISIFLMPVYGFLIIVFSRFLAEQFRALASIANNTKK